MVTRTPRPAWSVPLARCIVVACGLLAALGAGPAARLVAQTDWFHARVLSPRLGSAMAFDEVRQRAVLFGGGRLGPGAADTWEWDGDHWLDRSGAAGPVARTGHAMAYDVARQRVVLFGGYDPVGFAGLRDWWEWNGREWLQRHPPTLPTARAGHAMICDRSRGRLVLFGGWDYGTFTATADTWEWDGTDWMHRTPANAPSARTGHGLAYDAARQRTVLFGGGMFGNVIADTWEWDGNDWLRRQPLHSPPARGSHVMAYDPARQRVLVFGGALQTTRLGDTWEWDGADWTQPSPTTSPSPRNGAVMAFDPARGRGVLFGGFFHQTAGVYHSDTWEWNGTDWLLRAGETSPPARIGHAMASDTGRRRVVLFGGFESTLPRPTVHGDTWEWDGYRWLPQPATMEPAPRSGHAMAYDSLRQRTVLFGGGSLADTWEWDGGTWQQQTPPMSPMGRDGHAMAYDSTRQRTVLFGGGSLADTWEWDGSTWQRQNPGRWPGPRSGHRLAYDPIRQRVVLFGGMVWSPRQSQVSAETWEYDGQTWHDVTTPTGPAARHQHAMCHDPGRQRVVLSGGASGSWQQFDDTWEWDGVRWTSIVLPGRPTPRSSHALAYDAERGRLLLFGGFAGDTMVIDRRAHAADFGSGCAGSRGVPLLATAEPYLDSPGFALQLLDAAAAMPCVFALSLATRDAPIGGGCILHLLPPTTNLWALTSSAGFAAVNVPVPAQAALTGLTIYVQAAVVDPQGALPGVAVTPGRRLVLGG